jgi:hypothetical protein
MKFLKVFWNDILSGKNLDVYLTGIIALTVSILGVIGQINQVFISSAILATLALITNGLLVNRRENDEIHNALKTIISGEGLSNKFLRNQYDRSKLRELIQSSHTAFFWGPYLSTHITLLVDVIEERLKSGFDVRFLIMDPLGAAAFMVAHIRGDDNTDEVKRALERNIIRLEKLRGKNHLGKLEVRVIDYLPPYTIIALDPDLPSGQMFVRLNNYDTPNEKRPTFDLVKKQDGDWFEFFRNQFEKVWKDAHIYEFTDTDTIPKKPKY